MTRNRKWVSLLVLVTALALAPALWAQAFTEQPPQIQIVQQGAGWYLLDVGGNAKTGDPGTLVWMVTEEGLATVPLTPSQLDDLAAEFSGDAGATLGGEEPPSMVLLDKVAIDAMEQGQIPPGYEQYYEYDDKGQLSCGDQNKEKDKHFQGGSSASNSWPLGGGITGTFAASLPVDLDAHLYFRYKIKRRFCIPYGISFRNIQVVGTGTLDGNSTLSAGADYQGSWSREWQLLHLGLGHIFFWIGPVPVWIDFDFNLYVGAEFNVNISAEVAMESRIDATGEFDYTCTKSGCQGSNSFGSNGFDFFDLTAGIEARLDAQAYARAMLGAEVWPNPFITFLRGEAGLKGLLDGDIWGYYGNNCGDADGNGHNETVQALAADLQWGYDILYDWDILGTYHERTDTGPRNPLGWWDLLDRLGQGKSTALAPMLLGPAEVEQHHSGTYTVRMRPCYPYDDAVNFSVIPGFPGGGSGTIPHPRSSDPTQNSVAVSRTFNSAGPVTLTATNVSDAKGRNIGVPYHRSIEVNPPPPPPAPEIRVTLTGGAEVPDGGAYAFPPTPLAELPVTTDFTIFNDGDADLTITNPTGLVSGTGFSLDGAPPAATVPGGQSTTFRVRFEVAQGGPYSGAVHILNNDADEADYGIDLSASALAPCSPSPTRLCLRDNRFSVDVSYPGGAASARTFSSLSGFFWFANPDNLEIGVKVLGPVDDYWWFFDGPATDQQYTVDVFDTQTGALRTYVKPAGSLCGHVDTGAFQGAMVPQGFEDRGQPLPFTGAGTLLLRDACVPGATATCLNGGRFEVEVLRGGVPQPAVGLTPLSGVFTFANPDNVEVFVKVLGPVSGHWWVFYGSLSNQDFTVRVTDSTTQQVATYDNPAGNYCGIADTEAF
jgi:hypothetical protein